MQACGVWLAKAGFGAVNTPFDHVPLVKAAQDAGMVVNVHTGNSINAVKSQIWIAVCVYLIVVIAKNRLNLPASPQLLLNIFEVNMFEKTPIDQVVANAILSFDDHSFDNQLFLF